MAVPNTHQPPPPTSLTAIPLGYRLMTPHEVKQIVGGSSVMVLDRALGRVLSYTVVGYSANYSWHVARHDEQGQLIEEAWLGDNTHAAVVKSNANPHVRIGG